MKKATEKKPKLTFKEKCEILEKIFDPENVMEILMG